MRTRMCPDSSVRWFAGWTVALSFVLVPIGLGAEESPFVWEDVSRVIALGDVHGSFDKMVALLKGTKLVDDELAWTGGNQHLVFCGDLTDRGENDRAVMDLAKRLQTEAAAAGGRVHVVLGNHDVMNLTRDRRYWDPDLTDEFAKDETPGEREAGLKEFRAAAKSLSAHDLGAFEEMFPPGYFARARAFELDGEYGSWLIQQPALVKVNGVLFLHGGLTEAVAALGIDEINRRVTTNIRDFLAAADQLRGDVPFPADLGQTLDVAYQIVDGGGSKGRAAAAKAVLETQDGLAFAPDGPVWDRRTSVENERLLNPRVDAVLQALDAEAIMMGHTVTRTGKISSRFNGRVYRADVGMGYGRPPLAAVLQADKVFVFDPATASLTLAQPEPPQGEGWPTGEEDLTDHQLEKFLQKAEIQSVTPLDVIKDLPLWVLELKRGDMEVRALFGNAQESAREAAADGRKVPRRYQNVVAAYQLDRLIDLNMVPVSVFRKVDGKKGVVQIWIQGAWDLNQILEYGIEAAQLGDLESEIARLRAFTALIGAEKREFFGVMMVPASGRMMIADNGIAFSEDTDVGGILPEGCGPVGAAFLHALGTLGRSSIQKELGGWLDDVQIGAMISRRDELLEICGQPNPEWSLERLLESARQRAEERAAASTG